MYSDKLSIFRCENRSLLAHLFFQQGFIKLFSSWLELRTQYWLLVEEYWMNDEESVFLSPPQGETDKIHENCKLT